MNDVFKEQIVKRKPTITDTAIKIALVVAVAVIFFASSIFIPDFGLYILLAAGFGAYVLMGRLNIEYEYIFTNGELDIDIIYNKAKRKRLFSSHVNEFEIMAYTEDKNHTGDFNSATETLNYSSGDAESVKYAFLLRYKGKLTKIIFEPDEMMLKAISSSMSPRKFFIKR